MGTGFSGIGLLPLQVPLQYFSSSRESDSSGPIVVLAIIGVVIVITVILNVVNKNMPTSKGGTAHRKFSGFSLRRLTAPYGLNGDQFKLLEFVFRNDDVTDPERALANTALLDRHFKQAYRTIERGAPDNDETQQRLARLFALRNILEAAPGSENTGRISRNMAAVLFTGRDSFPVKILAAKGETVVVDPPRNALGTPIRIPKGARITLSFFTRASSGFSYDSRVTGSQELAQGGESLEVSLLGKAKPLTQRKFRRKQMSISCVFSFVFEEEDSSRRKRQPKLVVDRRRFTGTLLDISVGGCLMKSSTAIRVGSRLKLEISPPGSSSIACLGQVLRINRSGATGSVIHIKFLKVPRRAFNTINTLVFGYDD